MTELQLLTHNGLLELRKALVEKPELVLHSLEKISEEYPEVKTIASGIEVDKSIELLKPASGSTKIREKYDVENCMKIFEFLPSLTAAQASDERLWVTLALSEFHEYSVARWGASLSNVSDPGDLTRFKVNHILIKDSRDKWRNQSISRLWWTRKYAGYFDLPIDKTLEFLFYSDSDVISQILGKPIIGTNLGLAKSLIVVASEFWNTNKEKWSREKFRLVMKRLDLLGGRRMLSSLTASQLNLEVDGLFREIFEIDAKSSF